LEALVRDHWAFDVWSSAVTTAEDTLRTQVGSE